MSIRDGLEGWEVKYTVNEGGSGAWVTVKDDNQTVVAHFKLSEGELRGVLARILPYIAHHKT